MKIDPDADLVCVCLNCYRMIHWYESVLTIGEMKKIVEEQKKKEKSL
ncbi:MAG: hypothetical protein WCQ63_04490 [Methanomethylophilus sp.]|nr:hypothetical protein [Methanomethylophilus sp.]